MDTTVFVASKGVLDIYEDTVDTEKILSDITNGGGAISEYEFFEKHMPVYYARKDSDGKYSPLKFPDPKNYGMMAPELYSKAVTYKYSWQRLIESIIERKPSLASDIKKITVLALPITIMVFLIFVMVVTLGG